MRLFHFYLEGDSFEERVDLAAHRFEVEKRGGVALGGWFERGYFGGACAFPFDAAASVGAFHLARTPAFDGGDPIEDDVVDASCA